MSSRLAGSQFGKDHEPEPKTHAAGEQSERIPVGEQEQAGTRRDSEVLRLALIDSRPLVRIAVSSLLQASVPHEGRSGFIVLPFASPAEFMTHCPDPPRHVDMAVFNAGAAFTEQAQEDLRRLRNALAHLPLVLLCDQVDACQGADVLRQGIQGYIPTMLSPAVVIQAIRLVHAGGTFAPASLLLSSVAEDKKDLHKSLDGVDLKGFTAREREVLGLMWQGKSNKVIAFDLTVSESTVKVYVRNIMKKLGATNRTHAIFLLSQSTPDPVGE